MTRLEKLQEMLRDSPDDEFLVYALGMEFASAERHADALQAFARVIDLDPQHHAAMFQQAQLLVRMGRLEEARRAAATGAAAARNRGDQHAADEIGGFLASLAE
ncbi:MAG: tetratricopeptide repeat protein [Planctomyces sp.]|nr:tetratricopeptide repeat protein [Planctomyces sp.]